jgi:cell division septal protein FtsQ
VALLSSPKCAISEVQVRGAKETPSATLDTICASLVGQNFLRANRKGALKQAELLPTVASASLTRDWMAWPPRLVLTVHEREPFARVGAGKDWWVVDESGVPFREARAEDAKLYAVTAPTLAPKAGKALNGKAWKPVV